MYYFWIAFALITIIYSVISCILHFRSSYRCIASRSPLLLQITHWMNYLVIVSTLMIIYSDYLNFPKSKLISWTYESCYNFTNCVMVFTYLIRAYRLYLVFNLDKSKDSDTSYSLTSKYKMSQRWALKLLLILSLPLFMVIFGIWLYILFTNKDFGLFVDGKRSNYLAMSDILITFILQISMILMIKKIAHVTNEYQMFKEMFTVTFLLFFTPFFSLFIRFYSIQWLYIYVARNALLMGISSFAPLIMSYIQQDRFGIVSADMLKSLDLVLQHKISYDFFEDYLKRIESGRAIIYLDLYVSCQCYFDKPELYLEKYIFDQVKPLEIPELDTCAETKKMQRALIIFTHCKEILENDYFESFKSSKEYDNLRGFLYRQELLNYRISQTSLFPTSNSRQTIISLMNIYSED